MQSTSSLLCLLLYFFDLIFKIVRIRLCLSDLRCPLDYAFFLTFDAGSEAAVVSAIRASCVDQCSTASLALFSLMRLIVFLLYVFQPAFYSTVHKLFFVGDFLFASPAVCIFRIFSHPFTPCLVPALVRAVFVTSCARYVIPALSTRLFLRLYAVPFGKLVMARLRAGIAEPVFCYRIETVLACPVVWVILVIPVIFSDMFFFVITFL